MVDQADNLRQLRHTATPAPAFEAGAPMVVVTGGRGGVGMTTVALNLAAVMADAGERVLVVDAAGERSNLVQAAGVNWSKSAYTLSDVLAGRCTVAEAILPGPAGISLLANRGSRRPTENLSRRAQQRFAAELQSLRSEFDLFVVDLGSGLSPWTRRFWLEARLVLLVTTTDSSTLLDTYAAIKRSVADGTGPEVGVIVNQCEDEEIAAQVQRRLSQASERFLGRKLASLPSLPRCIASSGANAAPRVWERPDSAFGHAMLWLGRAASDVLSRSTTAAVAMSAA